MDVECLGRGGLLRSQSFLLGLLNSFGCLLSESLFLRGYLLPVGQNLGGGMMLGGNAFCGCLLGESLFLLGRLLPIAQNLVGCLLCGSTCLLPIAQNLGGCLLTGALHRCEALCCAMNVAAHAGARFPEIRIELFLR